MKHGPSDAAEARAAVSGPDPAGSPHSRGRCARPRERRAHLCRCKLCAKRTERAHRRHKRVCQQRSRAEPAPPARARLARRESGEGQGSTPASARMGALALTGCCPSLAGPASEPAPAACKAIRSQRCAVLCKSVRLADESPRHRQGGPCQRVSRSCAGTPTLP